VQNCKANVFLSCRVFLRKALKITSPLLIFERLANNYYIFSDYPINDDLLKCIANTIYSSYIALESALSYYQLMSEAVFQLTSLTTRKTNNFHNHLASFRYQTIKRSLFFENTIKGKENLPYIISLIRKKPFLIFFILIRICMRTIPLFTYPERITLQ
jgi:hypothetical protein